jgi:hypothetical protein
MLHQREPPLRRTARQDEAGPDHPELACDGLRRSNDRASEAQIEKRDAALTRRCRPTRDGVSGRSGIRTHERVAPLTVFKTD